MPEPHPNQIVRRSDKFRLEFIVRPLLSNACICSGPSRTTILISAHQSKKEAAISCWHEIIHLIQDAGNCHQSEDDVEAAAKKLALACRDIIEWLDLSNTFK